MGTIYIETISSTDGAIYIFWLSENQQPTYVGWLSETSLEPKYITWLSETVSVTNVEFIVYVPSTLNFDMSEMMAIINLYKLAGKRYTIQPY
jgi:hypothetical protein